ncbi:hypothetical protein ACFQ07_01400 [Actinomadura adrarensis]|uniref:Uncharacterized protein n=1 Tax=Actinomadura adrarensis TaxID=1819600 RepID=A0ABW3CAE3_9ACTN
MSNNGHAQEVLEAQPSTHTTARLWAWDVPARHTGGVTDDPHTATQYVSTELTAAPPGTEGLVRQVGLSPNGRLEYVHLGQAVQARRNREGVTWTEVKQ